VAVAGPTLTTDDSPFLGELTAFAKPAARMSPVWMEANGDLLSIGSNSALYSVIGILWGGDGRTVFGLPDLRGRIPVCAGQGPGLTARTFAGTWGSETKSFLPANMPRHRHVITVDSEAPVGVISTEESSPTKATSIDVVITFSEPVSGFGQFDVNAPGTISNFTTTLGGLVHTFRFTPYLEGSRTIRFAAGACVDEAQNPNVEPVPLTVVFDWTSPQAVITGPSSPSTVADLPVTVDFLEEVSGFTASDLAISNGWVVGDPQDQGNGRHTLTVRANGSGTVTVGLAAGKVADLAGNPNTTSSSLSVVVNLPTPYDLWSQDKGLDATNNGVTQDPDVDGKPNYMEFALGCGPLTVDQTLPVFTELTDDGGLNYLTVTLPVRSGATFAADGNGQQRALRDGVIYVIHGTAGLVDLTELPTVARTTVDTSGLPALPTGYTYQSFHLSQDVTALDRGFLSVSVQVAP
jgi:microcystin-dependent protein